MTARTVMAFDLGSKRLGIAIGQELTKTASPLTTLRLSDNAQTPGLIAEKDWSSIDALVNDWQPQAAVVGLPLPADGNETHMTKAAKAFGEALQKRYNLETYWVDERLTSAEAESMIAASPLGKKRKRNNNEAKAEIDRMAAKLILESWFNQQ